MIAVEPRVFLLAETMLDEENVSLWLQSLGGDATQCMDHVTGSDSEKLIEYAARRCYKSFAPGLNPNVTRIRKSSWGYHENIINSAHGSVMQHATMTFAIEYVSRVFTHELVRHGVGVSHSQESMRYVRLEEMGFWIPEVIYENEDARRLFIDTVETLENAQKQLATIFETELSGDFAVKKKLTSAFRRLAPDGVATGIVTTFNPRSLRHVLELRTQEAAEIEIRLVVDQLGVIAKSRWPMLTPKAMVCGPPKITRFKLRRLGNSFPS
jgi:thymidylate synthase (FAD)